MNDRKRRLADNPLFTKTDAEEPAENAARAETAADGEASASARAAAQESPPGTEPRQRQEPAHEANNQTDSPLEEGGANSPTDTAPSQPVNPELIRRLLSQATERMIG